MSNGNGDTTRKSHIQRIYKDDDPDTNPDMWVDIERIDELHVVSKKNFLWREKVWQFDWDSFDPNGENVTLKQIQDPNDSSNPSDPDASVVQVPVRDMVFVTMGKDQQYQGYKHFFINDSSNGTRETHSRRVYHYDISDDQLDDDKNPPSDPNDYLNALGNKDKDQYVEVEILDKYLTDEQESRDDQGNIKPSVSQEKKWLLDSTDDPLLADPQGDTSNDGTTINPDAGPQVDPPWRLDPLQNIVNVSFAGGLAVEFYHEYI